MQQCQELYEFADCVAGKSVICAIGVAVARGGDLDMKAMGWHA